VGSYPLAFFVSEKSYFSHFENVSRGRFSLSTSLILYLKFQFVKLPLVSEEKKKEAVWPVLVREYERERI
jgi:hypothetical protein